MSRSPTTSIILDGTEVVVPVGATILDAVRLSGGDLPTLCNHPRLEPNGACRMCLVKVDGARVPMAACTTPVTEGMQVTTTDEELEFLRRINLELHLADHAMDCGVCDADGACELQDLAYRYDIGATKNRTIPMELAPGSRTRDGSSPVLAFDSALCIKCLRCVRACDEIQGKHVLTMLHRGEYTFVSPEFGRWSRSSCDGCGECVQVCPTAALTEKPLVERIRVKDVDRQVRTTCGYCGVGCRLDLWIKNDTIVRVRGVETPPNDGRLCVKGRFGYEFIHSPERLTSALVRREGELVPVPLEEALDVVARYIRETVDRHGPDAIAGLASAKCTNEENYLFQKLMRAGIGTNNVDHCARLCHAPTVSGLGAAFGSGAMTNTIPEIATADCILITGANVTETHPVTATYIRNAVRRGAKVIVVDPRRIDIVRDAAIWLRQRSGSDVAWINGMLNVIITEGLADTEFIEHRTEGYAELLPVVKSYTPDRVEEITGIPAEDLRRAARLYATAKRSAIVYAMGITQHTTGTDNVLSLANLAMLTGQIGRPGTGVNPLRGQNNVQGACDMGGLPNVFAGYRKVTDEDARREIAAAWGVPELPGEVGLSVVEMMHAAAEGRVRGMYIMGENPLLSDPNITHVEEALSNLEFLVVQDIFLSETAAYADVVLPAAAFAEKEGTFTNSGRSVLRVRKAVSPPGDARPDWELIAAVGDRIGLSMPYRSAAEIMDEIASIAPIYGGISHDRLETEELHWPVPRKDHPGTPILHTQKFSRGKGRFHPVDWIAPAELPDEEYPFVLSTGRMLFHYHTGTMTRRTSPLNAFAPGAYAEINPEDLEAIGGRSGEDLRITTRRGEITVPARGSNRVPAGTVFIPFHFYEAAANRLTNDVLDPVSRIPELKVAACRVVPVLAPAPPQGAATAPVDTSRRELDVTTSGHTGGEE
ncbi:MAG: formate dehydrogenase subunit alpha [Alkalispirochaeta sp.]